MKKFKSALGVTLLEIMLVLAIAAMVIVMSVRYYQSAQASSQANTVLGQITNVVAAADSLSQASGSYAAVTTAAVQAIVPNNSMTTPWGSAITVTAGSATGYLLTIPGVPGNVCPLVISKLGANNHFSALTPATSGACPATATTVTTTYLSNP